MKTGKSIDGRKARLYYRTGKMEHFKNEVFAFALWLALPKGLRVVFRGAGDTRPVYSWDYADRP